IANRESWNIPLRISRLHDAAHTTPVICCQWGRGTGTLWPLRLKSPCSGLMIAVADSHPAGVTPDFGGQKQKAQPRSRQRCMLQFTGAGLLLPVEQHQPTVQIVG